jgi:hypothetical protein
MFVDGMSPASLVRATGHVQSATALGQDIQLIKAATRDEMGTALTETVLTLKAFPIRYSPFTRDVTQKIGYADDCDVLCYCSKKTIYDLGYTIEQLRRQYLKLRIDNKSYTQRYIEFYSQFSNDWLYIIIAGKK